MDKMKFAEAMDYIAMSAGIILVVGLPTLVQNAPDAIKAGFGLGIVEGITLIITVDMIFKKFIQKKPVTHEQGQV